MKAHLLEEAAKVVPDPQRLISIISKRVRQLTQGHRPVVDPGADVVYSDIALLEIIAGKLTWTDSAQDAEKAEPPDPVLCLSAIVSVVQSADDGNIVTVLAPAWREITRMLRESPSDLFNLTPRQWEELVAASYAKAGFNEVILTPRSGDFGRDVIATKSGWGTVRIIDQVKAYRPGHLVTANDVRALLGVLHGDPRATKAVMTTTSSFAPRIMTDPFIAPFCPYRLELVDGTELFTRLHSLATGNA